MVTKTIDHNYRPTVNTSTPPPHKKEMADARSAGQVGNWETMCPHGGSDIRLIEGGESRKEFGPKGR